MMLMVTRLNSLMIKGRNLSPKKLQNHPECSAIRPWKFVKKLAPMNPSTTAGFLCRKVTPRAPATESLFIHPVEPLYLSAPAHIRRDVRLEHHRDVLDSASASLNHRTPYLAASSNELSTTLPPASPRPATGRLYDQPANCCCIVCESIGPSTYESVGASEVNSRSKFAVSL